MDTWRNFWNRRKETDNRMKLIRMKCPACGGDLSVEEGSTTTVCPYCGSTLQVDGEKEAVSLGNAEKTGYEFEKGRMKAQQEAGNTAETRKPEQPQKPRKHEHRLGKLLLWIVFFPIMLTVWLWTSDTGKKMNRKVRIILTAALWVLVLGYYIGNRAPSKVSVKAEDVFLSDWLNECYEPAGKAKAVRKGNDAEYTLKVKCVKNADDYLEDLFAQHDMEYASFERTDIYLDINDSMISTYGSDGVKNQQNLEKLLNMKEGDTETLEFTGMSSDWRMKELKEKKEIAVKLISSYEGSAPDGTMHVQVPWEEHLETPEPSATAAAEESAEPVEETPEPVEETPEPVKEVTPEPEPSVEPTAAPASGIRPEFKEMVDSYEAFIDEYCDFMTTFSTTDDTTALLAEYAEYMSKYTDLAAKMDNVDESELSAEEDAYYTAAMARCSAKLIETGAAIQ